MKVTGLFNNAQRTEQFPAGAVIFREGDAGKEMYGVVEGTVDLRVGERTVRTLQADDIFGEMALIDDSPRSATVVAQTDVSVAPVSEKQYLFLVRHTPYFALKVMRVLAERLRHQNKAV